MAQGGVRGPVGSFLFMNLRLLNDQTLENSTGVGTLPWTWPVDEQVIDLAHAPRRDRRQSSPGALPVSVSAAVPRAVYPCAEC